MSEASKKYRAEMRAKANRLGRSKSPDKVDASSWSPGRPMNADKKTGARPIRAKTYKFGGAIQGDRAPRNAGKEPRADGGKVEKDGGALTIHDTATENKKKLGSFHDGGYKKGGRTEKCGGGPMAKGGVVRKAGGGSALSERQAVREAELMKEAAKEIMPKDVSTTPLPPTGRRVAKSYRKGGEAKAKPPKVSDRPEGTTLRRMSAIPQDEKAAKRDPKTAVHKQDQAAKRNERARGGKVKAGKGKTNINIIIGAPATGQAATTPPPGAPVRPPPPPMNTPPPPMMGPGGPPPGPPPGMPPGPPGPPPGMPPGGPPGPDDLPPGMPRARGGRTGYMSKDAGAGSGLGRLRKVHKEGQHTPGFKA